MKGNRGDTLIYPCKRAVTLWGGHWDPKTESDPIPGGFQRCLSSEAAVRAELPPFQLSGSRCCARVARSPWNICTGSWIWLRPGRGCRLCTDTHRQGKCARCVGRAAEHKAVKQTQPGYRSINNEAFMISRVQKRFCFSLERFKFIKMRNLRF